MIAVKNMIRTTPDCAIWCERCVWAGLVGLVPARLPRSHSLRCVRAWSAVAVLAAGCWYNFWIPVTNISLIFRKIVWRYLLRVVGSIVIALLQISCWVYRWKNFENQWILGKDMDKSLVSFLTHGVQCAAIKRPLYKNFNIFKTA